MLQFLFVAIALLLPQIPRAEPASTKHVTAELITESNFLRAGDKGAGANWIGLRLEMQPHWHTYWRYPGDSGLPTEVSWKLPAGWKVYGPYWPLPQRIFVPPLVNYGFEGEALIGYKVEVPRDAKLGLHRLYAEANWLVCKETCIPEKVDLYLDVLVRAGNPTPGGQGRFFASLRKEQPLPLPEGSSIEVIYKSGYLGLKFAGIESPGEVDFFPLVPQLLKGEAAPTREGDVYWLALADPLDKSVSSLSGLLVFGSGSDRRVHEISLPVAFPANALALAPRERESGPSSWILIFFAFLGGLILNFMPCVFPVLGIKVLALVKQSHGHHRKLIGHGHAYTAGVLTSFLTLGGGLLVLRGLGQTIGWGFQLQQPVFVALLILLFSFVTADLAGFVRWSGSWMGAGGNLANKEGAMGSFFTGVLAVVVATPCTAPFMGTAVGAAIAEPALVVAVVFAALGLGLSAPFLVLCYKPSLLGILPRPGSWMERMKELFAFPMAATVIWLFWVLTQQIGSDGALGVQLGLVIIVFSEWAHRNLAYRALRWIRWALIITGVGIVLGGTASIPPQRAEVQSNGAWKPYSDRALEDALNSGKAVFVDFTAAWCLTCQVNKKLVLDRSSMQDFFRERNVVLLVADWTNRSSEITRALERHDRLGVPLYLAFKPGQKEPTILPQVLTSEIVRESLSP